jgi:peptide/nickel transport system permease protein
MGRFILIRLASLVGVLLALTLVVFVIQAYLPTDPVAATLGAGASHAAIVAKRHELGYDQPVYVQYWRYLDRLAHGDLGVSLRTHDAVTTDLGHFAPASIELAGCALVLVLVLAFAMGLWSAAGSRGSGLVRIVMVALGSAPAFFTAIVLILTFYSWLGMLPASGRTSSGTGSGFILVTDLVTGNLSGFGDAAQHLILPAIVVAVGPAVAIGRVLRGGLLVAMSQDHAKTAKAKGMSRFSVLLRHGVRNAMTATLSMVGLQVGLLLTGVVVVETVFAWPGLGLYTSNSLQNSDFPAVMGVTLVLGFVYVIVNALVDIGQVLADPRLRTSR